MTTREAAALLGLKERRVQALIANGRLRAEKRGRDWWVMPASVEQYAASPRKPGRPPKAVTT